MLLASAIVGCWGLKHGCGFTPFTFKPDLQIFVFSGFMSPSFDCKKVQTLARRKRLFGFHRQGIYSGGSAIRPFEIRKHLNFKWSGYNNGHSSSPNHLKTESYEIWMFLSRFQMVFDKMAAICPDFKWLCFRISDPIQNSDHLQPNLFWTIQNPD